MPLSSFYAMIRSACRTMLAAIFLSGHATGCRIFCRLWALVGVANRSFCSVRLFVQLYFIGSRSSERLAQIDQFLRLTFRTQSPGSKQMLTAQLDILHHTITTAFSPIRFLEFSLPGTFTPHCILPLCVK